jgi:hypothetical protein
MQQKGLTMHWGVCSSVVECLPSKHEAHDLISILQKKKKKKQGLTRGQGNANAMLLDFPEP